MGGTGVSLLLPGVPLHCLKVPEGMACFTQLQAEPAVEIYPPRLQGPCGLCIYELCFLRWLLPNFFLRNGNGVGWGVSWGALLQRPKARCLPELIFTVDWASAPSPSLPPRPLPTQFLLLPTIMQSWDLSSS